MTFETTPAQYSSVNDPLVYVVYDAHAADPTTYPNYKYVGEVFVNGTLVFTGKYFPNPTSNRGIIDVSSIVREYITLNFNPASSLITAQQLAEGQWSISIVVKIREEYSGTVGAVVLTDSTRKYFNHYNGRIGTFTDLANYDDDVLSNRSNQIELTFAGPNYFISYFAETTATFNVVITGGTSTRTKTITPAAANSAIVLNISPAAINAEYAGNFTSASTNYTVAVGTKTYNVKIVCSGMYTNYYVHFLNKLGAYDSFLFNKVSRKTFDIEKKSFQQLGYRVSGSGVVSIAQGNSLYRQKTEFAGKYRERLKLNSDFVSDLDYGFLSELVLSEDVYLEDGGKFYPVSITSNNYEFKEHIVDGLINVMVEVEFGGTYKTQFQ
jgi:hypothetical protein